MQDMSFLLRTITGTNIKTAKQENINPIITFKHLLRFSSKVFILSSVSILMLVRLFSLIS